MLKRTKKDALPEETRYDLIAVVEGATGIISRREQVEGKVKVDNQNVDVTAEGWKPMEVPVIRVIGLHMGPIGFLKDVGAAEVKSEPGTSAPLNASPTASGSGTPANSAGNTPGVAGTSLASTSTISSGGGWFFRILTLFIGLVAAAAALLKANFAPLAASPAGAAINANFGGEKLAYVGLACAFWGIFWLLKGLIIFGLLVSASLIAAGLYAATDFLVQRGLLKPDLAAKIRPFGVPIGLACAAIAILHLLTDGSLKII